MNENRAFDLLALIAHRVPSSDAAQSAFDQVRAKHPERTWADPAIADARPRLIQMHDEQPDPMDMHAKLARDLAGTLAALRSQFHGESSSRESFWSEMASLGLGVNEHPQDGFRLLEALCDSLDIESAAADRAITVSVLDAWLKSAVAIEDHQPISGLLNRVADIGDQHWRTDANFHDLSGVDWLTRSINDWTGKSAQVWMKLPQSTPADDESGRRAALDAMKHGLTRLLDLSEAPSCLAAATIGSRVNLLFAVSPEWTVGTVLPLFDATKRFERAMSAWNGYLYSASADQQLLTAGLLEHYLTFVPRFIESQDPNSRLRDGRFDYRREVSRHLAEISLFRGIDPQQHGWLARYISQTPSEWRTAWAQALSTGLADMTAKARSAQWESWIRDYLNQRSAGRPLALDRSESSEVAEWTRHFDAEFPEFVELILTWSRVSLRRHSGLVHSISKPNDERDDTADTAVDVAESHPAETAKLLTHLLSSSRTKDLREYGDAYLVARAAARLRALTPRPVWQKLEQELLRHKLVPDDASP